MAKKIALGKGIASLIQATPNELLAQELKTEEKVTISAEKNPHLVDINEIKANPNQPRKIFKEKELEELADSIKENGIIQPLIVAKADKGFEIIAGERRWRAAKLAKLEKVPVVIKKVTEKDKMVMAIIENVQRSDLNCVEEALAYFQLMEDFNLTQEEVAKKLGKERSSVANYLRILKLPREVISLVQKDYLTFGHAKVLASIKEREKIIRVANEVVEKELSVRETEVLAKKKISPAKEKIPGANYNEKYQGLKDRLEQKTGFHFAIKGKKNGAGQLTIKFNNEAEFNDIYEYLLR